MIIEVVTNPGADDMAIVEKGMREFELSKLPDLPDSSNDVRVGAFVRVADNSIVGGISADVCCNSLEVGTLWVHQKHRNQGAGSRLLTGIEDFARSHGAVLAHLSTVEGRQFYERHGYEVYAQLDERPVGSPLYHMKKRL